MSLTLRSWWFVFWFGALVVAAAAGLFAGFGWNMLFAVPVLVLVGFGARQSLRLDERGVRYRSLVPTEGFQLAWTEVSEVVVDHIFDGAPGSAGRTVARVRFVVPNGAPRQATLFTEKDGARVLEVCRARGLAVLDER